MPQPIQVFVFGHTLSRESRGYIKSLDINAKIYEVGLHITRFDKVLVEMRDMLDLLKKNGADMSNYTRTIIVPSGSSVASLVFAAAWEGLTGDLPEVLNLINRGPERGHVPSPELPIIMMGNFAESLSNETEEADLISLTSLKSSIRQERRLKKTPQQTVNVVKL